MSIQISVIVCSHNPRADYLQRVLDALRDQSLPLDQWELLLVDNASNPALDSHFDLAWHPNARGLSEPLLGLTHARLRGIQEARAELLIFVDDDNVLDPDFLEQALQVATQWPLIGAWSGQTRPGFEEPPPEWTRRYWGLLVIRPLDSDLWSNLPHYPATMPCGAGLCVRASVARQYALLHDNGRREFLLDRQGSSLISAGDNDLAACACDLAMGVGVFASLKLTHLIPSQRLTEDYLVKLAEGTAFSGVVFRSFRSHVANNDRLVTRFANLARMLRMGPRERRFFAATQKGEKKAHRLLAEQSGK